MTFQLWNQQRCYQANSSRSSKRFEVKPKCRGIWFYKKNKKFYFTTKHKHKLGNLFQHYLLLIVNVEFTYRSMK